MALSRLQLVLPSAIVNEGDAYRFGYDATLSWTRSDIIGSHLIKLFFDSSTVLLYLATKDLSARLSTA